MAARLLQLFLVLLGLAAVAIGIGIFAFGPARIAAVIAGMFAFLAPEAFGQPFAPWTADGDSELRFYSVLWVAYGVIMLWSVPRIDTRRGTVAALIAIFFLGGVGRAISVVQAGWPHPFFVLLMGIELVLPLFLFGLLAAARPPKTRDFGR